MGMAVAGASTPRPEKPPACLTCGGPIEVLVLNRVFWNVMTACRPCVPAGIDPLVVLREGESLEDANQRAVLAIAALKNAAHRDVVAFARYQAKRGGGVP